MLVKFSVLGMTSFLLASSALAAPHAVECAGTLLGERVCAILPLREGEVTAPSMLTRNELDGSLAPKVAFVAGRFSDNGDHQVAESADGSLALEQGQRANMQIRDIEDRLKGWQIPGSRPNIAVISSKKKP